jgi:isopentenyl diphosphate isomerase/L-lactate dehydrogenase-like FMN-dependent dehydrogenase
MRTGRWVRAIEDRAISTHDLRRIARRRLPRAVFDAVDGGAGDERTLRANEAAYERLWLRPRALADAKTRDLRTTVLGTPVSMPVMLSPCGFARMCDSQAELAVARAAARAGTVFAVSGASSYPLEEVAAAAPGPQWYQLYMAKARAETDALLDRVEAAGYPVLCVTIDSPVSPTRERDFHNRLTVPLKPSPRLLVEGMSRPAWSLDFLLGGPGASPADTLGLAQARVAYWNLARTVTDMTVVTWDDIVWLRERWKGPLVLKGVQRGDEVPRIADLGVDAVIVSNHGARNLDGTRATVEVLPEVVDAAAGRMEVYLDGGIRRGADVLRALALGARACFVGRPYMFALAAAGEQGVDHVLSIFRAELEKGMALTGCSRLADIDGSLLERRPAAEPAGMR